MELTKITIKPTVQNYRKMAEIKNELEFEVASARIEELLKMVDNETSANNRYLIELDLVSNLVADYEEVYYTVKKPTLTEILKLRMFEMNITQAKLSEILGVSPSRISEYLTGKSEPTLKVARKISQNLKIEADIVLGV